MPEATGRRPDSASTRRRCACGHAAAAHWSYGLVQGCGHHQALFQRCGCPGYAAISPSMEEALAALLEQVAECERDWSLMDRIDLSLGIARPRRPRAVLTAVSRPGL